MYSLSGRLECYAYNSCVNETTAVVKGKSGLMRYSLGYALFESDHGDVFSMVDRRRVACGNGQARRIAHLIPLVVQTDADTNGRRGLLQTEDEIVE